MFDDYNTDTKGQVCSDLHFVWRSLFRILMIKTSYRHLENPKGIENKFEKNSISPIIGLDHEDIKLIIYDMSDKSFPHKMDVPNL